MDYRDQLLWVLGFLAIITILGVLIYRFMYRDTLRKSKTMTEKASALILSERRDSYYNDDEDRRSFINYTTYEFTVDDQTYCSSGMNLNPLYLCKRITIFYDPEDPKKSITQYEKHRCSGLMMVLGMLFAVFLIFVVPLLLMKIFL